MRFSVTVPASSANLGPGFDCLGVALSLFLRVQVETYYDAESGVKLKITYDGQSADNVPESEENLIVKAALQTLRNVTGNGNYPLASLLKNGDDNVVCLKVRNEVPLSRGLGSSASAIVAGIFVASNLKQLNISNSVALKIASEIEGHPDNVAASIFGGIVSSMFDSRLGICHAVKVGVWTGLEFTIAIPNYSLSTSSARRVLPDTYRREDSIKQLQLVSCLVATLGKLTKSPSVEQVQCLKDSLKDNFHQPFRTQLVFGLEESLTKLMGTKIDGFLGVVLSGAGPSILALSHGNAQKEVEMELDCVLKNAAMERGRGDIEFRFISTSISEVGVHIDWGV